MEIFTWNVINRPSEKHPGAFLFWLSKNSNLNAVHELIFTPNENIASGNIRLTVKNGILYVETNIVLSVNELATWQSLLIGTVADWTMASLSPVSTINALGYDIPTLGIAVYSNGEVYVTTHQAAFDIGEKWFYGFAAKVL